MEAAEESKRRGGKSISLREVLSKAGAPDEIAVGHLVGVEHDEEVGLQGRQHGVQLAADASRATHPRAVLDAELVAGAGEPLAVTVVEHDHL